MVTETETKVEEKEVEVVYCDKCGDECTDTYEIEPSEVCRRCSTTSAVERIADLATDEENFGELDSVPAFISLVVLFPLIYFPTLFNVGDITKKECVNFMLHTTGMVAWTLLIVGFILLLL
jgi:hypothetical protein